MTNNITYSETVKEAIAQTIFKLLETKDLNKISISEICETAGVSRISFYRNFNSKEEALKYYIESCYNNYFKDKEIQYKNNSHFDINNFLYLRFHFIKEYRYYFTILRKHHLLHYLFEELDPYLSQVLSGIQMNDLYQKAMFASCSAAVIRQWIDNDFKESEIDMVQMFRKIKIDK